MNKISISLPLSKRLDVTLVQRRKGDFEPNPILPAISEIRSVRRGNKISRVFRHIFEHKNFRRILGSNIAFFIVATSFIPNSASASFDASAGDAPVVTVDQTNMHTDRGIRFPLKSYKLNQGYRLFHPGVDLDGVTGDPVWPIMAGVVEDVQHSSFAYGNAIIIRHGDTMSSLYAHLSKIFVTKGQEVDANTVIGLVGSTGHSTGDHLHLEIHINGVPVNPLGIIPLPAK